MKGTVILRNVQALPHYPHAVQGQSGITYGHALFDADYNAHVFRLPYSDWAGKTGLDIASRNSGPATRYHVLFEPSDEPSDREKELSAKVEALTRDLQGATREIDRLQRAGLVDSTEPADRRITEAHQIASAAQDSQEAREIANLERRPEVQGPAEGLPSNPSSVDEANAGFLAAAKNGMPLEEKRVETNPETGDAELIQREASPVANATPSQAVGEATENPYVNVKETRTPLEPAVGDSALLQGANNADTTPVHDKPAVLQIVDAPVNEPPQGDTTPSVPADDNGDTDPNEKGGESDLQQYASNFRKLRSIAKAEGVEGFEKITKADDMIAAIELHRESTKTAQ